LIRELRRSFSKPKVHLSTVLTALTAFFAFWAFLRTDLPNGPPALLYYILIFGYFPLYSMFLFGYLIGYVHGRSTSIVLNPRKNWLIWSMIILYIALPNLLMNELISAGALQFRGSPPGVIIGIVAGLFAGGMMYHFVWVLGKLRGMTPLSKEQT
jgi:hypothetical protein